MKATTTAIGIGVLITALGAVYVRNQPDTSPVREPPVEQRTALEIEPGSHATPDPADQSQAPPATEIVMGIPVRKDRNCDVTRHYVELGNGLVTEAYSCNPRDTSTDDYELLGNDALAVLAYNDAKAARVLGKRLVELNPEQSRAWLLRAAALEPDNVEPLMWLASQAYSLRGASNAALVATANAYVITKTSRALGSDADLDWIIDDLLAAGLDDADIEFLDEAARRDLQAIRTIQLEVFGHTTIGEELL